MKYIRCSYCENGRYKINQIHKGEGGIGGLINGYWFCEYCIENGMKGSCSSESERWNKLVETAKNNNYPKLLDI